MKIHGDVHLAAHTLAYRRKAVHNGVEHFQVIQRPDGRDDRIFYGSKTFGQTLVCNFQHFLHREIPAMAAGFRWPYIRTRSRQAPPSIS